MLEFRCFPPSFHSLSFPLELKKESRQNTEKWEGRQSQKKPEVGNSDFTSMSQGKEKSQYFLRGSGLKMNIHHQRPFQISRVSV